MQGMIPRRHRALVQNRLAMFPAVAILGPRQCGKTTLARQRSTGAIRASCTT
jgi:predicted AAA+ superfamily ATPase